MKSSLAILSFVVTTVSLGIAFLPWHAMAGGTWVKVFLPLPPPSPLPSGPATGRFEDFHLKSKFLAVWLCSLVMIGVGLAQAHPQSPNTATGVVPQLESRPGAAGLIYLEFNGGSFHDIYWNNNVPFMVSESGLSTTKILQIYEVMKEDYLPFDINVTTKKSLYDARNSAGPPYKRIRVIFTPTDAWASACYPTSFGRGMSQYDAFRFAGIPGKNVQSDVPAFIFINDFDSSGAIVESGIELGSEGSHEVGHTLGLAHDSWDHYLQATGHYFNKGQVYFPGTGVGLSQGPYGFINNQNSRFVVWVPIMGLNESGWLTQWSQGDYLSYQLDNPSVQTNSDDVAVIAGLQNAPDGGPGNAVGYATDPNGNPGTTSSTARGLIISGTSATGGSFIGRNLDGTRVQFQLWRLTLPTGAGAPATATLDTLVTPAEPMGGATPLQAQQLNLGIANLYMKASLLDSNLNTIMVLPAGSDAYVGSGSPPDPNSLNPTEFLRRRIHNLNLASGTYYLKIEPSGYGNAFLTPTYHQDSGAYIIDDVPAGFLSYGSMGAYNLSASWTYVISITSPTSATGTVGLPMSYQIIASNGSSTYANPYSATGLPAGLSVNPATGLISGTPTASGTYTATIGADNGYTSTSMTVTFYVQQPSGLAAAVDSGLTFSTVGNAYWTGQSIVTHDGMDAAQSGPIGNSQQTSMNTTVSGPGLLSFWWKVSSEANADFLELYINGVLQQGHISGESGWLQQTFTLTAQTSNLEWRYVKNGSGSAGSDAGWVDQVVFSPGVPILTSGTSTTTTVGQSFSYQITAVGNATGYDAAGLPVGLSVNKSTGLVSGTTASPGLFIATMVATNAVGSGTLSVTFTVLPTFNDAVDNTAMTFAQGGSAPWFGQQTVFTYLGDAAKSGQITDGQQSSVSTTVTGPGQITFAWRTDSEPTNDYCKFVIETTEQKRISGNTAWSSESFSVPAGTHTLYWTYVKNASISTGADAAYLDQVAFSASFPNITSPLTVSLTVGTFSQYIISADNSPTAYSVDGAFPPGIWLYSPSIHAILTSGTTQPGVYNLPISVTNTAGTTHATITFNVESAFTGWARNLGLTGINALPLTDTDGDGICNFAEMAFNLNPTVRNNGFQPVSFDSSTKRLKATFQRSTDYPDVNYEVQVSPDLVNWTSVARSTGGAAFQNLGGSYSVSDTQVNVSPYHLYNVTVLDGTIPVPGARRFMRIKLTQQ